MKIIDSNKEKAQQAVYVSLLKSFAGETPRLSTEDDLSTIENDVTLPRKLRDELKQLKIAASEKDIADFKERVRKEKARQVQRAIRTKKLNKLAELEKEVRSDRTISKLQRMIQIREIQKQRANI